ncbi:MAG: hypothetical protein KGI60_04510 [Patescibacteria group bacterium]|nr:hypothetical protein [Patescibacteria group bacterium]
MTVLVLTAVLAIVYVAATYVGDHFPYDQVYWFFEFCHLLSGMLVAALVAQFTSSAALIVMGTLGVGCAWEIGEFITNYSAWVHRITERFGLRIEPQTFWDTVLDLVLDVVGAVLFVYFLR